MAVPDWEYAACRDYPDVNWFPDRYRGDWLTPKRICLGCPILDDCRAWSLQQGRSLQGIWGGWTEEQRRAARR
jgi:WhiB family redox-sensing transcriptional regulator